jgi:hypothetical protein
MLRCVAFRARLRLAHCNRSVAIPVSQILHDSSRPALAKQQPEDLRDGHRKGEHDQPVSDAALLARVVGDRPFCAARLTDAITWACPFAFAALNLWFDPSRSAA